MLTYSTCINLAVWYESFKMFPCILYILVYGGWMNPWVTHNHHYVTVGCECVNEGTELPVPYFHPLKEGLCFTTRKLKLLHNIWYLLEPVGIKKARWLSWNCGNCSAWSNTPVVVSIIFERPVKVVFYDGSLSG